MIQNSKLKIQNSQRGFTLIELLLAIAIIATVSVVGFVGFFNYRNTQNLKLSANELATVVRDTQKKSVTQQDGKRWGIRFENGSDGNQRFSVFNGSAFGVGSTTQSILIRRGVSFGSLFASSTYDMLFAPITGFPLEAKIITLTPGTEKTTVADIMVNIFGKTTLRIENGLVGYWHFDEGVGTTTLDASGNGNNGILVNNPTWQTSTNCKSSQCLRFSSGYINVGDPANGILDFGINDFSLSSWFYISSFPGDWKSIINKGGSGSAGYGMELGSASSFLTCSIQATGGSNQHVYGSIPSVNSWHHAVCVFSRNSKIYVYLDGVLVTSSTYATGNSGSVSNNLMAGIGAYYGGSWVFPGNVDEVRIYNRALSADEVKTIYEDLK